MRMRYGWQTAVVIAASSLVAASGCADFFDCDPATDPDCEVVDTGQQIDDTGQQQYLAFHYVLIRDLENSGSDSNGTNGAEIDAVELIAGGSGNYADMVDFISFGSGETDFQDQNEALGAPEGSCDTSEGNFVSLGGTGGTGGYLVVSFVDGQGNPQEIVAGDQVRVYGCGDTDEEYNVFIGVGTSPYDPHWELCGEHMSGPASCTIFDLPEIPDA